MIISNSPRFMKAGAKSSFANATEFIFKKPLVSKIAKWGRNAMAASIICAHLLMPHAARAQEETMPLKDELPSASFKVDGWKLKIKLNFGKYETKLKIHRSAKFDFPTFSFDYAEFHGGKLIIPDLDNYFSSPYNYYVINHKNEIEIPLAPFGRNVIRLTFVDKETKKEIISIDTSFCPKSYAIRRNNSFIFLQDSSFVPQANKLMELVMKFSPILGKSKDVLIYYEGTRGQKEGFLVGDNGFYGTPVIEMTTESLEEPHKGKMILTEMLAAKYYEYGSHDLHHLEIDVSIFTKFQQMYQKYLDPLGAEGAYLGGGYQVIIHDGRYEKAEELPGAKIFNIEEYLKGEQSSESFSLRGPEYAFAGATAVLLNCPEMFFKKLEALHKIDEEQYRACKQFAKDVVESYPEGFFKKIVYKKLGAKPREGIGR